MSLLYPAMLLGVLGLAAPVAIHLINRARFPVREFPSLRFLADTRQTNVFAPRLIDRIQLLLRLLAMLLLVLAMARFAWPGSEPAPRNLILVLDASASMQRHVTVNGTIQAERYFDRAKALGAELLDSEHAASRCGIVLAGTEAQSILPLTQGTAAASEALARAEPIDGEGCGLTAGLSKAIELAAGRREGCTQIVLLSDYRASALYPRKQADLERIAAAAEAHGASLRVALLDVSHGDRAGNVAIEYARLRKPEVNVGDDAHLLAHVVNHGPEAAEVKVQLMLGARKAAHTKALNLAAGGEAFVELTQPINMSLRTIAELQIDSDAYALDDAFRVPLKVADLRRVLIVMGESGAAGPQIQALPGQPADSGEAVAGSEVDGGRILQYVLNPGRELGLAEGTGIHTKRILAPELRAEVLSKYDIVVLYDVSSLPTENLADLRTYVNEGHALLIVCSKHCSAPVFNRTLASGTPSAPPLAPAQLGNEIALEPAASFRMEGQRHALWRPFVDGEGGDLSKVRLGRIREVRAMAEGTQSILFSTQGHPLILESKLGEGRVLQWMLGLELDRGNLALIRPFPAFMWRVVDYLTQRHEARPADVVPAMQPAVLDASERAFAFLEELELGLAAPAGSEDAAGPAERLPLNAQGRVLIPPQRQGIYELRKPTSGGATRGGYGRLVTAFVPPAESSLKKAGPQEFSQAAGIPIEILPPNAGASLVYTGAEAWPRLAALALLAYAAEAVSACVANIRRSRERAGEEA
ncbi:MAG: hypothetical protein AMXMBFR7_03910 [Planctomycetota bacterium]